MRNKLILIFIAASLLIALNGVAVASAPPVEIPGKGAPDLTKAVFVHYPKGLEAKGGIPGAPDKPPKPDDDAKEKLWYKYGGIHWANPTATYLYDSTGQPGDYLGAIHEGFEVWETAEGASFDFVYGGATTAGLSSLNNVRDGKNVVGWADLDQYGMSNAIAVTMVWYDSLTKQIIEIDMAFSTSSTYAWHDNSSYNVWNAGNTPAYDVDVQNIATHEAGHWLMLGDMYNTPANKQTMFGISAEFDLIKRTLESGDEAGIALIYPS